MLLFTSASSPDTRFSNEAKTHRLHFDSTFSPATPSLFARELPSQPIITSSNEMESEVNMESSDGSTNSAHDLAITGAITRGDNVPTTEGGLKQQLVTSQPNDIQATTKIPVSNSGLTTTMTEENRAADIMTETPSPVAKLEQPIEDGNAAMLDGRSHLAHGTHTNSYGTASDAIHSASTEDADQFMGAADDGSDLFGDDMMEEILTTVGIVDATIPDDPKEDEDDGRAYESDPGSWDETVTDEQERLAEQSLANYIAQQRRLERASRITQRGALDAGSEDDSDSSEEEDDGDDPMDVDSEMEHYAGDQEENGMEDDDSEDDEPPETGDSQTQRTHAVYADSISARIEATGTEEVHAGGNSEPSRPCADFQLVTGAKEGYGALRNGFTCTLRKRPPTTLPSDLVDDEGDMENIMNELAKEPASRGPSPTPPPQSPRRETAKGEKRSLAEMRSDGPRTNANTLTVAPHQTLQDVSRTGARPGFIPTRMKPGGKRGARGVPRRPDAEEGSQSSSPTPSSPATSIKPIATLSTPSASLPMPSRSLPMPSTSLPMPSSSLPMPSIRRSLDGANPLRKQILPANQPLSIENAQAAMLASMTAAKRAGASVFDTARVAPLATDVAYAPEDVDMEDYSWMEEFGENSAEDDVEYLELASQVRSLETRLASEGLLPAEQFDLLRMGEDLTKLERREPKRQRPPSEPDNIEDEESSDNDEEDGGDGGRNQHEGDPKSEELRRSKRRKFADEKTEEALGLAIQREIAQPTNLPTSSSARRPRNAREVRERDAEKKAEKQARRDERAFFNEGKASKSKKTNNVSPLQDPQARRKLFKNRLVTQSDDSRDDIIAKVLEFINPSADAIAQRLEQGEVPAEMEIHAYNKQQQLADLLTTIPADIGTRATRAAKAQMAELKRAARNFGFGKVKARNGRWLLSGMQTGLYHHQLDGANWMVSRELATNDPKGGILADAMGLGKTVTTLACIVGNPPDSKAIQNRRKATLVVVPASLLKQWEDEVEKHVTPEVLSKVQIYKRSSKLKLRVIEDCDIIITTYAEVLRSWNIKMTEAEIKTADQIGVKKWRELHRDELGPLHAAHFHRVVLDEAHFIKNWKSASAQACFHLNAQYRWCLTGTPMMNSLDELYAYFKFFRLSFTETFKAFREGFGNENLEASKRLSVMMHMVMKRRTFGDTMLGKPLLALPLPFAEQKDVLLTKEEVVIYRIVEDRFRESINQQLRQGQEASQKNHAHMLSKLLRLRQAVAHPFLLEGIFRDLFEASDIAFIRKKFDRLGKSKVKIFDQIKQWIIPAGDEESAMPFEKTSNFGARSNWSPFLNTVNGKAIRRAQCAFCHDVTNRPQIANCQHIFCKDCIEGQTAGSGLGSGCASNAVPQYACPQCETLVDDWTPYEHAAREGPSNTSRQAKSSRKTKNDYYKPPVKSEWLELAEKNPKLLLPSSKTIAVKAQMLKWLNEAPEDKIIIFTQFRAMARVIGLVCQLEGIEHVYFTGDMTHQQREIYIEKFHAEKNIKVMIANLKCGGVGLNLSCANRVISVDPWWNHAIEQQAFARVFRLGQKKPTHFVRLFAKDTVDYRIRSLQRDKITAIDEAMLSGKLSNLSPLSLEEIAGLFGQLFEEEGVLQVRRDYVEDEDADEA